MEQFAEGGPTLLTAYPKNMIVLSIPTIFTLEFLTIEFLNFWLLLSWYLGKIDTEFSI